MIGVWNGLSNSDHFSSTVTKSLNKQNKNYFVDIMNRHKNSKYTKNNYESILFTKEITSLLLI